MALACLLTLNLQNAWGEPKVYSFGIVPQQSAGKLARLWGPLLAQLSEQTGDRIVFKTAPDIPTFERRLLAGEYDFAYMNPYHYTIFEQSNGYRALAKARDKKIKGIIVVRKDSPAQRITDLDGTTLAFPAPSAFAASILTRSNLRTAGVAFTPKYVSSHDSVYLTVARGLYPAGGGVMRTLNNVAPEIRNQLRVLWTSQGYTPHAIAAHPRVSQKAVDRLRQALIDLELDDKGKALLEGIHINGFTAATDSDWDDVRALGLKDLSGLRVMP
jgi:phosphonate transport system substrate-binding protein